MNITLTMELNEENLALLQSFLNKQPAAKQEAPQVSIKAEPVEEVRAEVEAPATEVPAEPIKPAAEEAPAKKVAKADIMAKVRALNTAGHRAEVLEVFKSIGAAKLSDVPEDQYELLLGKLVMINA